MEKAFIKAVNILQRLQKSGLIKGYALTGGVAVSLYVSYRTTFDIDFFVDTSFENFQKIYEWLKTKGYIVKRDWEFPMIKVEIDNVLIELLLARSFLKDAIKNAKNFIFKGKKIPVLSPEALILTKLERGEKEDLLDIEALKKEVRINEKILKKLKTKIKKI